MPEENAQVTENTIDPKNVIAPSPLVIASEARQSVPNPPQQAVDTPAQQSFEIPPFTPPPPAPATALGPVIAASPLVIDPKNVIAESAPKNVIARSEATRQSIRGERATLLSFSSYFIPAKPICKGQGLKPKNKKSLVYKVIVRTSTCAR